MTLGISVPSLVFLLTFVIRNSNDFYVSTTLDRQLSEGIENSKIFKCIALKVQLKYTAALLCFSGLLTHIFSSHYCWINSASV